MTNTLLNKCLQIAVVGAGILVSNTSHAAIIGGRGVVGVVDNEQLITNQTVEYISPTQDIGLTFVTPPEEFTLVALEHFPREQWPELINPDLNFQVFNEKQDFTLTRNLRLWDGFSRDHGKNVFLEKGTTVSSHVIYINPQGGSNRLFWSGEVEFNGKIAGLVARSWEFGGTNKFLGLDGVDYNIRSGLDGPGLGKFAGQGDEAIFTGKTLSLSISAALGYEAVRVITYQSEEVPEPSAILASATAMGFGSFFKRKKSKQE
ncbi:MAG: PEP-CTERM sorting domain-containing protein [Microcoleaceae cyanobacterium MO_207.B10]|nr:PEP-CTERM sorting domain-containing protein [Microcoleaceae cyanobacterium MO_207.B10]